MNISIIGPGRAGGAIAIAAVARGHRIVSVEGRSADSVTKLAAVLDVEEGRPDLRLIAVPDDSIAEVASQIASGGDATPTVHISGAVGITALEPIGALGVQIGSLHPLQTFPDAESGAAHLEGAWMAVTAQEPLRETLHDFATSLGCSPFDLGDDVKALYHAGATAAANFTLTTLDLSQALFVAAGVPFEAVRPLVEATVANAFDVGPGAALTGPVARGDVGTVAKQLGAIREQLPAAEALFVDLLRSTAKLAGRTEVIEEALQ